MQQPTRPSHVLPVSLYQLVEAIANEQDLCGESPLWSSNSETLSWVDITGKRLHTFSARTGAVRTTVPGIGVSALALTPSTNLIAAGGEGIWMLEQGRPPVLMAKEHQGDLLAINDTTADPRGRLLAGSTFFDGSSGGYKLGRIYSFSPNGQISVLDDGFHLANGMGFSVDARTLYATDSIARAIYAYDYNVELGSASSKKVLVKISANEGLPDGLTVDSEGFIWSAQWFGGCLCRYDPDGRLERRVAIPAEQVSSLAFGGVEFSEVFVTTAAEWDALAFAPPDYSISGRRAGGQLFCFRADVQGKPEYVCKVQLTP